MRKFFCLAVCLAAVAGTLAAAASASGPRIAGERRYKPHALVRLTAADADPKAGLLWRVHPSSGVQRATTARGVLEFAAPPGSYEVELLAITTGADGALVIDEARATVVIESCHPPETPTPPNPPAPQPGGRLDPPNAIGRITFGNAGCSATVVYPRRPDGKWDVLTAAHCIANAGQRGSMRMPAGGKVHGVTSVVLDRTRDICWLVTDDPVAEIEYAILASKNPPVGALVWHQGYGVDRPRNREDGSVADAENSEGQLRFVLNVSSGDSGGGIFRTDTGELVGTVCCTTQREAKASVWAGSCEQAWKMRPTRPGTDDGWTPIPIPTRPAAPGTGALDHWAPTPMPLRPDLELIDTDGWRPSLMPLRSASLGR